MATVEIKCRVKKTVWYYVLVYGVKILGRIINKPIYKINFGKGKPLIVAIKDVLK